MIIDTHCHLDFPEFDCDRREVIERAKNFGVNYIINVSSSIDGCFKTLELIDSYRNVFGTLGIHPHYADDIDNKCFDKIKDALSLKNKKIVAIGEIGLDYYKNFSSKEGQKKLFRNFLDMAKEFDLPIMVHSRDAFEDTLNILKEKEIKNAVFHCFSGAQDDLKAVLENGFFVSYTANITFKKADILRKIVKETPLDKFFVETDAPFLAPQAKRGERNEPAYLSYLVEELSNIFGIEKQKIEEATSKNAVNFFKLKI